MPLTSEEAMPLHSRAFGAPYGAWSLEGAPHVIPGFAPGDLASHDVCNTEGFTQRGVGLSLRGSVSQFQDTSLGQFGGGVILTFARAAQLLDRVTDVFTRRYPFEVFETVVRAVSVLVVGLFAFARRAVEGGEDQACNVVDTSLSVYGKTYSEVAVRIRRLAQNASSRRSSAFFFETDIAVVGCCIDPFVLRKGSPNVGGVALRATFPLDGTSYVWPRFSADKEAYSGGGNIVFACQGDVSLACVSTYSDFDDLLFGYLLPHVILLSGKRDYRSLKLNFQGNATCL